MPCDGRNGPVFDQHKVSGCIGPCYPTSVWRHACLALQGQALYRLTISCHPLATSSPTSFCYRQSRASGQQSFQKQTPVQPAVGCISPNQLLL